jgi:hypothetical protein
MHPCGLKVSWQPKRKLFLLGCREEGDLKIPPQKSSVCGSVCVSLCKVEGGGGRFLGKGLPFSLLLGLRF